MSCVQLSAGLPGDVSPWLVVLIACSCQRPVRILLVNLTITYVYIHSDVVSTSDHIHELW